jgi:hypothetical protein
MNESLLNRIRIARRTFSAPVAEVLESRRLLAGGLSLVGQPVYQAVGHSGTIATASFVADDGSVRFDSATIDWGDGSGPTPADIKAGAYPAGIAWYDYYVAPNHGAIQAEHAYAHAGTFNVTTTIVAHVPGGPDQLLTTTSQATADVPRFVANDPRTTDVLAGSSEENILAQVTANYTVDPSTLSATIDWGDGSAPSAGHLELDRSAFSPNLYASYSAALYTADLTSMHVKGGHAYATPGTYTATITLSDPNGITGTTTATVVAHGTPLLVTPSGQLSTYIGATGTAPGNFSSLIGVEDLSDGEHWPENDFTTPAGYTATIDWGDHSAHSTGDISASLQSRDTAGKHWLFNVSGQHDYATPGDYTATVTFTNPSGQVVTSQVPIHAVADVISLTGTPIQGTSGTEFRPQVAVGLDPAALTNGVSYASTIDWGDGSTPTSGYALTCSVSAGLPDPVAGFLVYASHTYAQPGTYTIHVTATNSLGETASVVAQATIDPAPISDHSSSGGQGEDRASTPVVTVAPTQGPAANPTQTPGTGATVATVVPVVPVAGIAPHAGKPHAHRHIVHHHAIAKKPVAVPESQHRATPKTHETIPHGPRHKGPLHA